MSNRQHEAIHIHLLSASTSGAWAPSSMSSMNSMDSSTCRSFFISFVFVSFNTLSTRCWSGRGSMAAVVTSCYLLLPPKCCILYLIARSLYIFLTSHRNGSCVVQTSSSARVRKGGWAEAGPGLALPLALGLGMGMGTYGARVCLSERAAKWALGFGYWQWLQLLTDRLGWSAWTTGVEFPTRSSSSSSSIHCAAAAASATFLH